MICGSGAGNFFILNQGAADELTITDYCYDVPVGAGNIIFAQSGAGGGWGDPLRRAPGRVLDDVRDGYVSINGAKQNYCVVIDAATMTIDAAATASLRADRSRVAERSVA